MNQTATFLEQAARKLPLPLVHYLLKARYFLFQLEVFYKNKNAIVNPSPIFILGHQKTGTTVIAALLAELTNLSLTLDFQKELLIQSYPKVYLDQLPFSSFLNRNRCYFSNAIIKEPNLTLLYPQLKTFFPNSKYVFIIRDPRDTIRSILDRLNFPGNLKSLNKIQQRYILPGWSWILDISWMSPEFNGSNYIEMLAHRWNLFTNIFLQNQDNMILVSYEQFRQQKENTILQLAHDLNLPPINDISSKVNIQHQHKGNQTIKWIDFFGEDNLRKIESICNDNMNYFGYLGKNTN